MERLALGPVLRSEVALCGRLAIVIVSYIDLYLNTLPHKPVECLFAITGLLAVYSILFKIQKRKPLGEYKYTHFQKTIKTHSKKCVTN